MNNEAYSSVACRACQAFGFVSNSDWRAGLGLHDLIYKSFEDAASLLIEWFVSRNKLFKDFDSHRSDKCR